MQFEDLLGFFPSLLKLYHLFFFKGMMLWNQIIFLVFNPQLKFNEVQGSPETM